MNHDRYSDDYISGILSGVRSFAVVGASANPVRASYIVMQYLIAKGYEVKPVNPGLAGQMLLGRKVYAIVNYDDFAISPELLDDYTAMIRSLYERYYSGASRYATNGFLRIKLGQSLENRGVAPHIFESAGEAAADWRHEALSN